MPVSGPTSSPSPSQRALPCIIGAKVGTICEGVETESQVLFLRDIGCSKLQGYYFSRPIPLSEILERYDKGSQMSYEDYSER